MYHLQEKPDPRVVILTGNVYRPVATLKDDFDRASHIILEDHCYLLVNGSESSGFLPVMSWHREAVAALKNLPLPE